MPLPLMFSPANFAQNRLGLNPTISGGVWPLCARGVAVKCANVEPVTESIKVLLLRDLKTLFDERGERLESEKIVTALLEIEGHP